jgi:hypothetical protein
VRVGRLLAAVVCAAVGCSGPPASDAELCRDVIHRLCQPPRCSDVDMKLGLAAGADCEAVLLQRTGCGDDAFALPNRANFLSCRLPLIRAGDNVETHPDCLDVDEVFRNCPSMVTFIGGTP